MKNVERLAKVFFRELQNAKIEKAKETKPSSTPTPTPTPTPQTNEIAMLLAKLDALQERIVNIPTPQKVQQIGFKRVENDTSLNDNRLNDVRNNDNRNDTQKSDNHITTNSEKCKCKHCQKEFVRNAPRHVFCSTECRVTFWEVKNGVKLNKKPK